MYCVLVRPFTIQWLPMSQIQAFVLDNCARYKCLYVCMYVIIRQQTTKKGWRQYINSWNVHTKITMIVYSTSIAQHGAYINISNSDYSQNFMSCDGVCDWNYIANFQFGTISNQWCASTEENSTYSCQVIAIFLAFLGPLMSYIIK